MKKLVKGLAFAAAFSLGIATAQAWAPGQMTVSDDLYCWLQSTDRMNYYVDRQRTAYKTDKEGEVDFYTLVVPVVKSYDGVQVKDVIERRRWNDLPTEGFEKLAGETGILEINLLDKTVTVKKVSYVDFAVKVIFEQEPNQTVEILKLPEKHVERRFYEGIIAYEGKNFEEIIKNTKGKQLSEDEMKHLLKEHKKAQKTIGKKYDK